MNEEGIYVPIEQVMIFACALTHVYTHPAASWRIKEFVEHVVPPAAMVAFHWAGHQYLRDCCFNEWHGE